MITKRVTKISKVIKVEQDGNYFQITWVGAGKDFYVRIDKKEAKNLIAILSPWLKSS